jgi:hypothetical protein
MFTLTLIVLLRLLELELIEARQLQKNTIVTKIKI